MTPKIAKPCAIALLSLGLAACGGGGGGEDETISSPPPGGTPPVADTVAPTVVILTPDDDGAVTVTDATVTLSGQAADNVGVSTLRWQNDRGGSGLITVSANWSSPGINLQTGDNLVTVTAEDAAGNSRSDSIRITLSQSAPPPSGSAPSISGSPAPSVMVGSSYSFTPNASDPDGDNLSFTAENLPNWLSFDSGTGQISGAPSSGDLGEYGNIIIAVSDGEFTTALEAFSITVTATASSSVTINWTPPTTRTDGSPLNGVDGYRVLYGTQSGVYPNQDVVGGGLTSYTIDNLTPGTYYVAMKAVDSFGIESALSNEVIKTAQ